VNLQQQNLVQILLRVVYYSTCFILEYIFSLLGPTLDTRIKVMLVTMNLLKQCSSLPMFLIIVMVNCSVAFQSRLHEATAQNRAVAPTVLARIPYFQKQQKQQIQGHLSIHTHRLKSLFVVTDREPDQIEMMIGGERFEMVPLPDRMCDTTIFVGNICEFVHDEDLSQLFQAVSVCQSVPSCVVRKANMQSLGYGFVSFPTVEEKEVSLLDLLLLFASLWYVHSDSIHWLFFSFETSSF